MQFRFSPVGSFEDTQGNFEQLQGIFNGPGSQPLSFLQLLTAGNVHVAYGSTTVTWDGVNDFTDQVTVPHGLPGTPAVVIATGNWEYADVAVGTFSLTATTFGVQGSVLGATPAAGSSIVYWLAIR